jgi:hypothetical protein
VDLSTTSTTPVVAPTRRASLKRAIATVVTAALAVGGLTVVAAAPASATETDTVTGGTFTWNVSDWSTTHLSTRTPSNGASVDAGVVTWGSGTGTYNAATGASDIQYTGTARLAFQASPGNDVYQITLKDPEVIVDASGAGQIVADVDYNVYLGQPSNKTSTDVVVTRFQTGNSTADTWSTSGATATLSDIPAWAGVIPAGTSSAITDVELPFNGESFAEEFLLALPSSLRSHFYSSKASGQQTPNPNNQFKDPSQFTATVTVAKPSIGWITTSETNAGYVVSITGDGFRQVTLPGDSGIYVSIAPSGGRPGSEASDADKYLTTKYVSANLPAGPATAPLTNGAFSTSLTAPANKIDPDVEYSIYTWQAHTASNTTQDTETPLTIDYEALERFVPTVSLSVADDSIDSSESTVATVSLSSEWEDGVTGSVEFFDGTTSLGTETIVAGAAELNLPNLSVGTHAITAKYSGDANHPARSASAKSVEVSKLDSTISLGLSGATATVGTAVIATATVNDGSTGTVEFFDGTTSLGTSTISSHTATKSFSDLSVGSHSITAKYLGDDTYEANTSDAKTVTIAKATASVSLKLTKAKEVFGNPVSATATVTDATGNVEFFVNDKKVKTVALAGGKATLLLPKYSAGTYKVTASYLGNGTTSAATSSASSVVITKATTSKVTVSGKKFKKNSKPTVTIKVAKLNNGQYPVGKVGVYVGGKLVKTANLYVSAKGTVKVTLPKQSKTIKVKAIFSGSNVTSKSSSTVTIKRK